MFIRDPLVYVRRTDEVPVSWACYPSVEPGVLTGVECLWEQLVQIHVINQLTFGG